MLSTRVSILTFFAEISWEDVGDEPFDVRDRFSGACGASGDELGGVPMISSSTFALIARHAGEQ